MSGSVGGATIEPRHAMRTTELHIPENYFSCLKVYAVNPVEADAELDQLVGLLTRLKEDNRQPAYGVRRLQLVEGRHQPSYPTQVPFLST